jgi:RNA polymerase sigma factor (sigma-70 family)
LLKNYNDTSNLLQNFNVLIAGALQGDRKMQFAIYELLAGKMFVLCKRYAANKDEAQDMMQEGFIKVFNNLDKYRYNGSFEGWVRRIMVNTAIEKLRSKKPIFSITEEQEDYFEHKQPSALNNLGERDLLNLINQLPEGYKMVFNLYEIEGYSHKEIASLLNIAEGTSKSQLARAKQLLRKELEEKFGITD